MTRERQIQCAEGGNLFNQAHHQIIKQLDLQRVATIVTVYLGNWKKKIV